MPESGISSSQAAVHKNLQMAPVQIFNEDDNYDGLSVVHTVVSSIIREKKDRRIAKKALVFSGLGLPTPPPPFTILQLHSLLEFILAV
jgi:hypothetical protein